MCRPRVGSDCWAGLSSLAILIFRDYGISNDEEVQHRYGELIVNYYTSGFRDTALFNYKIFICMAVCSTSSRSASPKRCRSILS